MRPDSLESLREDLHVGPDVTDAVMARLGYRPVSRRTARLRRLAHVAICLGVIAASIVGVAWTIDLGWRARLGTERDSRRASNPAGILPKDERRWDALEQSLRPLRRIVEEIDAPPSGATVPPSDPPVWISARAPLGEA